MRTKDRRFIKTENTIQKSMIKLLNEMNAEFIQIDDLIYEADINKSTFYLHYQSLPLLVSALEDGCISGLSTELNSLPSNHSRFEFFEKILIYIKKNIKLVKAVFNASTYSFNEKLENLCKEFLIPAPVKNKKKLTSNIDLLESSLVQSVTAYVRVWCFDGCKFNQEKVIEDLVAIAGSNIYKDIIR